MISVYTGQRSWLGASGSKKSSPCRPSPASGGDLYAFNAATGAILLTAPLSAGTNAAVTLAGDYVTAGAGVTGSTAQRPLIIDCKLGAKGKLPGTVGS